MHSAPARAPSAALPAPPACPHPYPTWSAPASTCPVLPWPPNLLNILHNSTQKLTGSLPPLPWEPLPPLRFQPSPASLWAACLPPHLLLEFSRLSYAAAALSARGTEPGEVHTPPLLLPTPDHELDLCAAVATSVKWV